MRQQAHTVRDGNDDLCLLVATGGPPIHMRLLGRSHGRDGYAVYAGQAAHLRGNEERSHIWSPGCNSQTICVPRARVIASVGDLDKTLYDGVPPSAALSLLTGYAKVLAGDIGPMDGRAVLQASETLTDLFILALGSTRDGTEAAKGSVRAALLARIKDDIADNLANPDLSIDWSARRHGLRPRAIQDIFYGVGESFTAYLLECRLAQAHKSLVDPANAGLNIAQVAMASGFGNISWFNNAFRKRFGMTPGDARDRESS
jgi:AraC-like DNA-binding protein